MKKILLIGCIMLFVFCAPRKTIVETEGLEEVIVFGEEETIDVSEEPVLPQPVEEEIVAPPELVMPPLEEEEITEMTLPPVIEDEPIMPIIPVEETPPPVITEYIPPTLPTAPAPPSPTKVFGFRIQIFASSTEKNASRVADDAKTSFPEYVYVEYVPPYYKVRVGDCLTREDAEVLKNKALRLGYRGAFVIETMITP